MIAKLISVGIACGLTVSEKSTYEIVMEKYNKCKKEYQLDQRMIKPFEKLYRKRLHYNLIDEDEYESQCNFFAKDLDGTKNESFFIIKKNINPKLIFF